MQSPDTSTQLFSLTCIARVRATRPLRYCKGSSGPSHLLCHVRGHCNFKRVKLSALHIKDLIQ